MSEPTADRFRDVMGRFATGVSVLTTSSEAGPHGMTANAVSSVSLEPLLVLACIERDTVMADLVEASGCFALSFLGSNQEPLSWHFADPDRPLGDAQFQGIATISATTGAPVLPQALGWIDCRLWATYDGGDHVIVVGEVADLGTGSDDDALLYYRSRYARPVLEPRDASP